MGTKSFMADEVKMIYIQMLDEDFMVLSSNPNDLRNRMFGEYMGCSVNPGPEFARKILQELIKDVIDV